MRIHCEASRGVSFLSLKNTLFWSRAANEHRMKVTEMIVTEIFQILYVKFQSVFASERETWPEVWTK